ncbi:MAG TPA: hypothetical protein VNJ04_05100 [Gemmatimonadaceae bacterium]|nr:hypothetical protein [Gemmatimonadaceae bacterium]
MSIRDFLGASIVLFAILYAISLLHCTPLTPAEHRAIAGDAVMIGVCQSKGRICKDADSGADCFGIYDDCMVDAGLRK